MARYTLRPKANADLGEILAYTRRQWSNDQADAYLSSLPDTFSLLADASLIGAVVDVPSVELRRFVKGPHLVFYIPISDGVEIVRILHGSMDAQEILKDL